VKIKYQLTVFNQVNFNDIHKLKYQHTHSINIKFLLDNTGKNAELQRRPDEADKTA
jgi:hypothetical protein